MTYNGTVACYKQNTIVYIYHHSFTRLNLGIAVQKQLPRHLHSSGSHGTKVAHFLEDAHFRENKSQRKCALVVQLSVMHFTDSVT